MIVASAALRTQQCEVSILQQRLSIRPISGIYANANTHRNAQGLMIDTVRHTYGGKYLVSRDRCI